MKIIALIIIYILFSCARVNNEVNSRVNIKTNLNTYKTIQINALLNSNISFYDIFDSVSFIKLNDSNIKDGILEKIKVIDSNIYLLNSLRMEVLKVNNSGDAKIILSKFGYNSTQYTYIEDYDLDKESGYITIIEPWGNIMQYDNNNKFLYRDSFKIIPAIHFLKLQSKQNCYLFSETASNNIFKYNLYDRSYKQITDKVPYYFRKTFITNESSPFYFENNKLFYFNTGWGEVYSINNSINQLELKINTLPFDFDYSQIEDNYYKNKELYKEYLNNNEYKILKFGYVYIFEDKILGSYKLNNGNIMYFYVDSNNKVYNFSTFLEGISIPFSNSYIDKNNLYFIIKISDIDKNNNDFKYLNLEILKSNKWNNLVSGENNYNHLILKYKLK